MDDMQKKIDSILSDPGMMQQIMSMASSLSAQPKQEAPQPQNDAPPQIDLALVQKLSTLARQSGIDHREQALLQALGSYLSGNHIRRLERAMRAAKMAKMASSVLSPGGLSLMGR